MTFFQADGPDPEDLRTAWRRVADEVGGTFAEPTGSGWPLVQTDEGDWILTLEVVSDDAGLRTRLRAPFPNPRRVKLTVRDERLFDDLARTLGFVVDVEVGDPDFDRRFLVKGYPASEVRHVLPEPVRGWLLEQPRVELEVTEPGRPTDGGFGLRLPPGVSELRFADAGEIVDPDRLVSLFQLFRELLPRLDPAGRSDSDDPETHLERLRGPGGVLRWKSRVVWNGDARRREAARALAEVGGPEAVDALLAALDGEDPGLVVEAARSLGVLGARRAVPRLVRLLGQVEAEAEDTTVAGAAGRALGELGHGDLARAFRDALAGRARELKEVAGPHRDRVIEALMDVVDSFDFDARVRAAQALGELGANQALPLLRSRTRNLGMKTRLTEAAEEAVREIESKASLVRPATSAPEEADTHPRPADGNRPESDTLPRTADRDDA